MRLIDLAGRRFNRLVVLARVGSRYRHPLWSRRCDCGTVIEVTSPHLRYGGAAGVRFRG